MTDAPLELGELLDQVELFIRRYVILDEAQAVAAALWTAHTHAIEAAYATAYLFITSPEPECGKTRLLEVLHELVREPLFTMNVSEAALFRAIDTYQPTLLFDEVDAVFSTKARERGTRDDLAALVNAGYRRGGFVLRMGGGNHTKLQKFGVFSAKALAGLGTLPPTLASRCLHFELRRRRADEKVADFFPQDVAGEAGRLNGHVARWAETALDELSAARPDRVDGLRDRQNEVWRPLLAIAKLAGDAWLARARRAAVGLAAGETNDEPSLGLLLLSDIRAVFEESDAERLSTRDLLWALTRFEESPWGEWWFNPADGGLNKAGPRRLSKLLRPYGIRSSVVRIGADTPRGYRHEDFFDAWERFL